MEEQIISEAAGIQTETFSEDQLATMQGWADADGWLKDDGVISEKSTPDAFGNDVTPSAYVFEVPHGMEPVEIEQLAAVQVAMTEAGIPAAIGNQMAREWNRYMAAGPTDETTLRLSAVSARQELIRKHGAQQAAEIIRTAKAEIQRFAKKTPFIAEGLATTEAGNSVWLAETLWNLAQARKAS